MNHREGGWPSYVKTENKEAKAKFLSRVCKEDMFKFTTIKLAQTISKVLKENNTVNLEQIYFSAGDHNQNFEDDGDGKDQVTVICKLKDFSKRRRPVSCLSWQNESLAVSHCSSQFLGCYSPETRDAKAAYICDISVSSCYSTELVGPGHITVLEFNERNASLLAAGCYDGQVCFFDQRTPQRWAGLIDFNNSHRDAVYGIKWVGKSGAEFLTGSQDGLVKWWDVRKFVSPTREYVVSCDEGEEDVGRADSLSCLSFEPTIPSKFQMGTNQGNVISCRLTPKVGTSSLLLSAWRKCYHSPVMTVERNPAYPKYFLTVGGDTAKVWCEDLKTDHIMATVPSPARLSCGAWSPSRLSMFYSARLDGFLDFWDFVLGQRSPLLSLKMSDYPLHCLKVERTGRLLAVGAGEGSTSIVSIPPGLASCSKQHRNTGLDMLERETRRERILENRSKAIKIAQRRSMMMAKRREVAPLDYNLGIEKAEKTFFETVKNLKLERERNKFPVENLLLNYANPTNGH